MTLLIENPALARCDVCKYPLSGNENTTFICDQCNKQFHFRCIWGEFYLGEERNWRKALRAPRKWICGSCLVKRNIMIYYAYRNEWLNVFVMSYNHRTRSHIVKWRQDMRVISLGNWRVRLCEDTDTFEQNIENTTSNESVIIKNNNNGIRSYKQMSEWNKVESLGYHTFPQIVSFELNA